MTNLRPEHARIAPMYDYAIAVSEPLPEHIDTSVVFGRQSAHLLEAAGAAASRSEVMAISGNVGRDSGELPERRIPESTYVADYVRTQPLPFDFELHAGTKARSGLENAWELLDLMHRAMAGRGQVTTVMHGPQARRLHGTFAKQAARRNVPIGRLSCYGSDYPFTPDDSYDQYEVAREITLLHELSKGSRPILDRPDDLPDGMLEYAYHVVDYRGRMFKETGIRNPSTADDTDRSRGPLRAMLFNTRANASLLEKPFAYAGNAAGLARVALRQHVALFR